MTAPLPVLFTHYGDEWLRGSENVLLDLLRHLDRDRVMPVVWCNGAAMADACRDIGVPTYRRPFAFYFDYPGSSPPFSPRGYAALVREAASLVRRHDIRVLHANSAAPTQWLAPAAAWTRRPLLTHLHIGYRKRSRYALLLHQADLVVGVAEHVTRPLIADGVARGQIRTIHNGIDPTRLVPASEPLRARLGIPADALLIGSIGSLIRRKGHDVLLQAMAILSDKVPEVRLVIAGSGADGEALAASVAELGLKGRVCFAGHLPDPGSLYAACDLFVLAARDEGLPLVLAEAGWFGLPSIATRVGGIPEVIRDGDTGLLVPPEDPAALAGAIVRLLGDSTLRARMGRQARQHVEAGFTVRSMAAAFEATYAELAAAGWSAGSALRRLQSYLALLRSSKKRP